MAPRCPNVPPQSLAAAQSYLSQVRCVLTVHTWECLVTTSDVHGQIPRPGPTLAQ